MKITLEQAKNAISRFNCSISLGFPALDEMFAVETEEKGGAELRAYDNQSITRWMQDNGGACPQTRAPLKPLGNCKQLFSLILALVEASGHLEAVKADEDFNTFAGTPDYTAALETGRTLLAALVAAPGADLKAKIETLNLREEFGSNGQMRLLEHILGFDLKNFADYREPGQAAPNHQEDDDLALALSASLHVVDDGGVLALERALKESEEEAAILEESRLAEELREEAAILEESRLAEELRKVREHVREQKDFDLACEMSQLDEVPVRIVVAPAVEVKGQGEVKNRNEDQSNERMRLEIEAAHAQKALDNAILLGDQIGALSAMVEQDLIEKALKALVRVHVPGNGPAILPAAMRAGVGLVAGNINAPVLPPHAAPAALSSSSSSSSSSWGPSAPPASQAAVQPPVNLEWERTRAEARRNLEQGRADLAAQYDLDAYGNYVYSGSRFR